MRPAVDLRSLYTIGDQVLVSATNFATSILIARNCSLDEFGKYALAFSVVVFLISIQDSIITLPYTFARPRMTGPAAERFDGSTLVHQFALSTAAALLLGAVSWAAPLYPVLDGFGPVFGGAAVAIGPFLFRDFVRRFSFANLRPESAFYVDCVIAVLQVSGLAGIILWFALNAQRAYWVAGAVCGTASLFWLITNRRNVTISARQVGSDFRSNWLSGRWMLAANLTSLISNQLYLWLLPVFHDTQEAAALAACQGIIALTNPLLLGFRNVLLPRMSHVFANEGALSLARPARKAGYLLGLVMGMFALIVVTFSGEVLTAFYGVKYTDFALVLAVLTAGTWMSTLGVPPAYGLLAMDHARSNFRVDLVSMSMTLTIGLVFVITLGAVGAAYALLVSASITVAIRWRLFYCVIHGRPSVFHGRMHLRHAANEPGQRG